MRSCALRRREGRGGTECGVAGVRRGDSLLRKAGRGMSSRLLVKALLTYWMIFVQAGYTVVTTSTIAVRRSLLTLPEKMVLVLSRERPAGSGARPDDLCVKIQRHRGDGKPPNVSVATGVLLAGGGDRIKRRGCGPVTQRAPGQ